MVLLIRTLTPSLEAPQQAHTMTVPPPIRLHCCSDEAWTPDVTGRTLSRKFLILLIILHKLWEQFKTFLSNRSFCAFFMVSRLFFHSMKNISFAELPHNGGSPRNVGCFFHTGFMLDAFLTEYGHFQSSFTNQTQELNQSN